MTEPYIPHARDATVAFFGRRTEGRFRYHCVCCNDKYPLSGYAETAGGDPDRIHGDLYATTGDDEPCCDMCGVTFLSLSLAALPARARRSAGQVLTWSDYLRGRERDDRRGPVQDLLAKRSKRSEQGSNPDLAATRG